MARNQLSHGQTGNFDDLRIDVEDPSDTINDPKDPDNGKKRFLVWTQYTDSNGKPYLEAIGRDGIIYRIVDNEPPVPPKKGKVEVINPNG